jgi:serine/threonine-protein kinase
MPLLRGRDLESWFNERAPLDPAVAVRILLQAGDGLRMAHEYGIVHRDIKPSNIFLEEQGDELVVRVSDFGVAKIKPVDEQHITRTGSLLGSPLYMAPEQMLRPHDVDPRADVWSLAMTLYHALAGQAPLARCKNFTDLVLTLSQKEIPPLQDLAPWVDPRLARVIHGALIRDVNARCPGLDAFLEALEPFAGGTTRILPDDLASLPEAARAVKAERAVLPAEWEAPPSTPAAPAPPRTPSLVGSTIGGRFLLDAVLHESPFATLYSAAEGTSPCVVKLFRPEISARREWLTALGARLDKLRGLKSDHLTRVLGHGHDESTGLFFVASERLKGTDLGALIRSRGNLEPGAVARAMVQLGQGLSVAHGAGVIHENIKPSNVFLQELDDGRVLAKLCDFGQPCPLEHPEGEDGPAFSIAGQFALSPMYLSPEQVQGKPATMRSDLWSMALVLYEALAGRKPWQGHYSLGELLLAIQNEEIRPIREVAPWVEGGLAEAIHGGLRRDPSRRYSSIRDMIVALGPFAASARTLQISSFSSSRPSIIIHSDKNASPLDKTALADSSNAQPRVQLPSTPPPGPPQRPPSTDTMISVGAGTRGLSPPLAILLAVVAAVLVVGLVAFFLQ